MLQKLTVIYTLLAAFLLVSVDQYTKHWARESLLVHSDDSDSRLYQGSREPIFEIGKQNDYGSGTWMLIQWNYVRNHGAAWGVLSSLTESMRSMVFQIGTFLLSGFLVFLALQKRWAMPTLTRVAILIIVAGALSNLYDRISLGYVVDVLDLRWQFGTFKYVFPAFNMADAMIVGALVLATGAEFFGTHSRGDV